MKKLVHFTKIFLTVIAVICIFSLTQKKTTLAENKSNDFEENEEYYYDLCSSKNMTEDQVNTCTLFRNYLEDKQDRIDKQMDELLASINELKANIEQQQLKISELSNQVESIEIQITNINKSIEKIQINIEELNVQIADREVRIATLDGQIKESMVLMQANLSTNAYLKFLMGADSFVDLIRRIAALNDITEYNTNKIQVMQEEKTLLEVDKNELQYQKDNLAQERSSLEATQANLVTLMDITEQLIDEYRESQQNLSDQWDDMEEDYSDLDEVIGDINEALNNFTGSRDFGLFVKNVRFYISSACYYYKGENGPGRFHAAIDVARTGFGCPTYAIANGYVFRTGTGCDYNGGYIGNSCNGGKGNFVFLVVMINHKYYTVYYEHLKDVNVKTGQTVVQGQQVGTIGNSGSSTGLHLHFAIYYQGTEKETTIEQIVQKYRKYGIRFGLTYNITGSCSYRNWKAPCFENPMLIYNVYRKNYYTWGE